MADDVRRVTFVGSLPGIQSALSVSGTGEGARMKIDIPQSDADVIPLIQVFFTQKLFRVTLELIDDNERPDRTVGRTKAKRRVE